MCAEVRATQKCKQIPWGLVRITVATMNSLLALFALSTMNPSADDIFRPSKSEQVTLGKRVAVEVRKEEKVLPATDERVRTLRRVAQKLLEANPDPPNTPWEYSFDGIDSKQVNAFALPGGPVFFYLGLIDLMLTEDQLAAVLAHELTHVRKEHWAKAYADSQKRSLALTLVLILTRANRTISGIADIANDVVLTLPFSRKHETEADDVGYEMMVAAGYNPQGMADVFKILREASSGGKPPEFLSTHPDDKNRIKRVEERIAKGTTEFPPQRPLPFETSAMKKQQPPAKKAA